MEPLGGPLSTQCTPSKEYSRPPLGFSKGKPLATSTSRPKTKNPWGLRSLGFLAFGLALEVASSSPLENPLRRLQSSPLGSKLSTLGNLPWGPIHHATSSPFPQIVPGLGHPPALLFIFHGTPSLNSYSMTSCWLLKTTLRGKT